MKTTIELPDDHEIVQRARQYAANRETGNAAEHMQASIEDDIGMAVRVEVVVDQTAGQGSEGKGGQEG